VWRSVAALQPCSVGVAALDLGVGRLCRGRALQLGWGPAERAWLPGHPAPAPPHPCLRAFCGSFWVWGVSWGGGGHVGCSGRLFRAGSVLVERKGCVLEAVCISQSFRGNKGEVQSLRVSRCSRFVRWCSQRVCKWPTGSLLGRQESGLLTVPKPSPGLVFLLKLDGDCGFSGRQPLAQNRLAGHVEASVFVSPGGLWSGGGRAGRAAHTACPYLNLMVFLPLSWSFCKLRAI